LWQNVASSADGTKLTAMSDDTNPGDTGTICTSLDSGATWTITTVPGKNWFAFTASADGCKLAAVTDDKFGDAAGEIYTWQVTPKPELSISPTEGNEVISWTVPSQNFGLQQNSNLTTTNWTDVTSPSTVLNLTNLQNQVTISRTNSSRFYRLVH
jgi:hypothetical protein